MTYRHPDLTLPVEFLEEIAAQGFDILPELIRIVVNEAMRMERQNHLGVAPYQRSPERQGHANGYKPHTTQTRLGEITFDMTQAREGGFYPQALEKGLRSERALTAALAEMYVQGVSTRKVKAIVEKLCGSSVSSSQVSRATQQLDDTLASWRQRPLGEVIYVYLEARLLAALAGGGTVTFACSGTITLTAEIVIAADTTIDGSGQTVTISGNGAVRVFSVMPGVMLNVNGLAVASGYANYGGSGIDNEPESTLTASSSTFSGTTAIDLGGGICNGGMANVSNSTFVGNDGGYHGGGIYSYGGLTVSNSTLTGNSADYGGGVYNYGGMLTLKNTIVANRPAGNNCFGTITDGGGNLSFRDATCPSINADPMLGPLQDSVACSLLYTGS